MDTIAPASAFAVDPATVSKIAAAIAGKRGLASKLRAALGKTRA